MGCKGASSNDAVMNAEVSRILTSADVEATLEFLRFEEAVEKDNIKEEAGRIKNILNMLRDAKDKMNKKKDDSSNKKKYNKDDESGDKKKKC